MVSRRPFCPKWRIVTLLVSLFLFASPTNAELRIDAGMLSELRGQSNFSVPFIIKPIIRGSITDLKGAPSTNGEIDIVHSVSLNHAMIGNIYIGGRPFDVSPLWNISKICNAPSRTT